MTKDRPRIVIVSADKGLRWSMGSALLAEKFLVEEARETDSAVSKIGSNQPHLVLVDFGSQGGAGPETIRRIRETDEEVLVLLLASKESREEASEAEKLGGCHTLEKPIDNTRLVRIVRDLLADREIREEAKRIDPIVIGNRQTDRLILGRSRKMREVYRVVERVSRSPRATVLIEGESGTGKEMIAKAIHHNTVGRSGPFMEINCGSLPANLLESELFGHEAGAFTDAKHQKKGLIEMASNGTLFLDEIGEMPIELQAALLRVIETKRFKRVGGTTDIEVDLRITAATNQDLKKAVAEGRFRKDLFYRLNVVPIRIPPLRERAEDLPVLASYFIDFFNHELTKNIRGLSPNARTRLEQYSWPGNVRELRNLVEIAFYARKRPVDLGAFLYLARGEGRDRKPRAPVSNRPFKEAKQELIRDFEENYVSELLEKNGGNISKTARQAGIERAYLQRLIRKHGLK